MYLKCLVSFCSICALSSYYAAAEQPWFGLFSSCSSSPILLPPCSPPALILSDILILCFLYQNVKSLVAANMLKILMGHCPTPPEAFGSLRVTVITAAFKPACCQRISHRPCESQHWDQSRSKTAVFHGYRHPNAYSKVCLNCDQNHHFSAGVADMEKNLSLDSVNGSVLKKAAV